MYFLFILPTKNTSDAFIYWVFNWTTGHLKMHTAIEDDTKSVSPWTAAFTHFIYVELLKTAI